MILIFMGASFLDILKLTQRTRKGCDLKDAMLGTAIFLMRSVVLRFEIFGGDLPSKQLLEILISVRLDMPKSPKTHRLIYAHLSVHGQVAES